MQPWWLAVVKQSTIRNIVQALQKANKFLQYMYKICCTSLQWKSFCSCSAYKMASIRGSTCKHHKNLLKVADLTASIYVLHLLASTQEEIISKAYKSNYTCNTAKFIFRLELMLLVQLVQFVVDMDDDNIFLLPYRPMCQLLLQTQILQPTWRICDHPTC